MKIAFVGKGGSGKSTMTALFIRYLESVKKENILAIDADLNMNLAGLLGVEVEENNILANPDIQNALRIHLKGSNPRIADAGSFLPTTPPGQGSNTIQSVNDAALKPYAVQVGREPVINLLTVGAYGKEEIGQSCYHTHLFMAENLLSHTNLPSDSHVVCDMVAGTDAFAYSLHLQFDVIVLIAEPTPESVQVCNNYLSLAKEAGVDALVHLVANKIEDEDDLKFIQEKIGLIPLVSMPVVSSLKKSRQQGGKLDLAKLDVSIIRTLEEIYEKGTLPALSPDDRMGLLYRLHEKLMNKNWVKSSYGDVTGQLDENFLKKTG